MPDLDVPTAVRAMLDRSTDAARSARSDDLHLHEGPTRVSVDTSTDPVPRSVGADDADLVLVDLAAPPRRNRRALVAAALVVGAVVGGGLAIAAASGPDAGPGRTAMATAPASESASEPAGRLAEGDVSADLGARLIFGGDRLEVETFGPDDLVESAPVTDAPPVPGAAAELFEAALVVRVGPPAGATAPDEWNGTVHLASGEAAVLRTGDDRLVEIDAGDVVIVFGNIDPALGTEDLAQLMSRLHLERVG